MNIKFTQEQIDALSKGESISLKDIIDQITINPPSKVVKQWEPSGGNWYIDENNKVMKFGCSDNDTRLAGRERATEALATRSAKRSRRADVLEAFRDQYWPDWETDWKDDKQEKWYPAYDHKMGRWVTSNNWNQENPCVVYGPYEYAEQAAEMLNEENLAL